MFKRIVKKSIAMNVAENLSMNYMLLNYRNVLIDAMIYLKILLWMNVGKTFVLILLIKTKHLVNIVK
jgi:hypothetical protein